MNYLSRIPVWFWYLFSVAYCYVIWNPFYSYPQLMQSGLDPAIKTIITVLLMIVGSLYIVEGHRTLNIFGIILFLALFGAIFWFAARQGLHGSDTIQWWGQWIVGLFLTIALQGGRIYRALTGRVPVGTTVVDEPHHG